MIQSAGRGSDRRGPPTVFIRLRQALPAVRELAVCSPCYGGGRGTNACQRHHLQSEQTELTATQLDTNAAGEDRRREH